MNIADFALPMESQEAEEEFNAEIKLFQKSILNIRHAVNKGMFPFDGRTLIVAPDIGGHGRHFLGFLLLVNPNFKYGEMAVFSGSDCLIIENGIARKLI